MAKNPAPRLEDKRADFARTVLLILGIAFMGLVTVAMTPYTHQLDDIKMTLVRVLGPLLTIAYLGFLASGHLEPPRRLLIVPLGIYFASTILAALFTVDFARWKAWEGFWLFWSLLGPFFVFLAVAPGTRQLTTAFKFFAVMTLITNLFGIIHVNFNGGELVIALCRALFGRDYVTPSTDGGGFFFLLGSTFRSTQQMLSLILNRNFYAAYLLLMVPLVLSLLLSTRSLFWRILCAITLPLSIYCIFKTRSRISAFIAIELEILVFCVLLLFIAGIQWRHRLRAVIIFAGLLLIVAIGLLLNIDFVMQKVSQFGVSLTSRRIIWSGAFKLWLDHPLLGGGLGSFDMLFPFYRARDYFLFEISHRTIFPHNWFLSHLSETGILGFLSMMSFLAILFWKNLRQLALGSDPRRNILIVGLVSGMTGFLINNATSPNARWPICAIHLWAGLGMMAGIVQVPLAVREGRQAAPRPANLVARKQILHVLIALSVIGWLYSAKWGIDYFRSARSNNRGLVYIGNPPEQPGRLYQIRDGINELEQAIRQAQPGSDRRQQLQQRLLQYQAVYRSELQKARGYFETAKEINPSFITSRYKLATILLMGEKDQPGIEEYREALEEYKSLQEYGPRYSQVQLNIAQVNRNLAILYEQDARSARAEGNEARATELEQMARDARSEAVENARIAASMSIDLMTNRTFFSLLQEQARRDLQGEEKLTAYHELLEQGISLRDEWLQLIDADRIAAHLKTEQEKDERREEVARLAATLAAQGAQNTDDEGFDLALVDTLEVWKQHGGDPRTIEAEIFEVFTRLEDWQKAAEHYQRLIEQNPANAKAHERLGIARLNQRRPREALRQALVLENLEPQSPDAAWLRMKVHEAAGHALQARQAAQDALQRNIQGQRRQEAERLLTNTPETGGPAPVENP